MRIANLVIFGLFSCAQVLVTAQSNRFIHQHSPEFSSKSVLILPAVRANVSTLVGLGYNRAVLQQLGDLVEGCILVQNNGTKSIQMLVVRYDRVSVLDPDRIIPEILQIQLAPPNSPDGGLPPGGHALLTPWAEVTRDLKSTTTLSLTERENRAIGESFDSKRYGRVVVTVDSAVFSDGQLIGPDDWNLIQQRQDEDRGQREIYAALANKASLPRDEIISWLEQMRKDRGMIDPVRRRPDYYKNSRATTALTLEMMLRDKSVFDVVSIYSKAPKQPPLTLPHR